MIYKSQKVKILIKSRTRKGVFGISTEILRRVLGGGVIGKYKKGGTRELCHTCSISSVIGK